jgi:hypothetical protein
MDSPYSEFCAGNFLALGARSEGFESGTNWIRHHWLFFENRQEPINGGHGSAILDEEGRLFSFFRFSEPDGCAVSVSATVLREFNYEICGGLQNF